MFAWAPVQRFLVATRARTDLSKTIVLLELFCKYHIIHKTPAGEWHSQWEALELQPSNIQCHYGI